MGQVKTTSPPPKGGAPRFKIWQRGEIWSKNCRFGGRVIVVFGGKTGIKSLPVRSCEPRNCFQKKNKSLLCGMGCVGDSTSAYFQNRNVFWFLIRMKESWNSVIFPIHLVISVLYFVSETTPNSIHKTHKIHQPPVATSTKKHFNMYIYIYIHFN